MKNTDRLEPRGGSKRRVGVHGEGVAGHGTWSVWCALS